MKKILSYCKFYIRESILGPLFKFFEAAIELFVPLMIAAIIDNGISKGDSSYAVSASLILVLLGAIGLAFSITAQYFAAKAAVGSVTMLRHDLFSHIQSLSHRELDAIGTSSIITRLTADANQVQAGINLTLRLLLRSPFVVFGAMVMAFTIDFHSALTFVSAIPALALAVFAIMLISIPLFKRVQARLDSITAIARDNLAGARVIRAFAMEEHEAEGFRDASATLTGAQKRVGRISALLNPITFVIINLAIIVLISIGAIKVDGGFLTQGQVVALYNYMSQILVELIKLANLIISVTKAVSSAGRINDVFAIEGSIVSGKECEGKSDTAIEFSHVSFTYKSAAAPSLSDISFSAKRGETIGIIGGTGAGKTSLINLIPRFYDASSGNVLVFGRDVREYDTEALRRKVRIVPQKAMLFEGTVRDNIRWGKPDADDEEIFAAITAAQANGFVLEKGGLDAEVELDADNFSGGQRQRLTVARAIVGKPDIIIFDDSSSALDYATDAAMRRDVRAFAPDSTLVIVSQRTSSIMHADRIIVLDDGVAVGVGRHEELLESSPIYREIYNSQFGEVEE